MLKMNCKVKCTSVAQCSFQNLNTVNCRAFDVRQRVIGPRQELTKLMLCLGRLGRDIVDASGNDTPVLPSSDKVKLYKIILNHYQA